MRSLEEPEAPRGRGLLWILLVLAMLGGAAAWYVGHRPAAPTRPSTPSAGTPQSGIPSSGNEPTRTTERNVPDARGATAPAGKASRASGVPRPTTPPAATVPAREFRVTSDVPGAYVFLNRKFLGTTPLTSRDVAPGTYQLNVQTEGHPPVVRTVDVTPDGLTEVAVTIPAATKTPEAIAALDAQVAVVHQHAMGACEGTLRASGDGFRYDTPHKDAFAMPFASVEAFAVDYADKRLRLKQRGGRTWNFTTKAANADPLFVFHRDVEAARR